MRLLIVDDDAGLRQSLTLLLEEAGYQVAAEPDPEQALRRAGDQRCRVVPGPGGRLRIYLVSDDNFGIFQGKPTDQRTLLLAFDWTPPKGH